MTTALGPDEQAIVYQALIEGGHPELAQRVAAQLSDGDPVVRALGRMETAFSGMQTAVVTELQQLRAAGHQDMRQMRNQLMAAFGVAIVAMGLMAALVGGALALKYGGAELSTTPATIEATRDSDTDLRLPQPYPQPAI